MLIFWTVWVWLCSPQPQGSTRIFLHGITDTEFEKNEAEDVAWSVNAVVDVQNNIGVRDVWHFIVIAIPMSSSRASPETGASAVAAAKKKSIEVEHKTSGQEPEERNQQDKSLCKPIIKTAGNGLDDVYESITC